jgi:hypothetical protein
MVMANLRIKTLFHMPHLEFNNGYSTNGASASANTNTAITEKTKAKTGTKLEYRQRFLDKLVTDCISLGNVSKIFST